jgi:acetylornithine deacetylase
VNVGSIAGGVGATSVAAPCVAEVCVTFHPRHDGRLGDDVREIVDAWAATRPQGTEVELDTLHHVAAFEGNGSLPLAEALLDARTTVLGSAAAPAGFPTGSDGRLYAHEGRSPVVIFGPGDVRTIHAPDEWVDLAEVDRHAEVLREFFGRVMRAEPDEGDTR